jgi:hypothetical protein
MPNEYNWLSFMFAVYFFHILIYINGAISLELLPIISILKLEGLVELLCRKMKIVTRGNVEENERKLNECIKLHVKILK